MVSEDEIVKLIERVVGDYFNDIQSQFNEIQTQITKLRILTEKLENKLNGLQVEFCEIRKSG